ncbi:MAG TPA: ATP-binding protein [Candidatus Polarisedimenticolia bacterium]|nr:ATP-binding protein [Candidatus Polarisedimenticolia bacterium]
MRRFAPLLLIIFSVPLLGASEGPRRILILNSFGRDFTPYNSVTSKFREDLARLSPKPVELLDISLETMRFDTADEAPVVDYVGALCARRPIDLVVAIGSPAYRFWERHRAELLPDTPALIAAVEERHFDGKPPEQDAVVALRLDLPGVLENLLAVRPGTHNVYVVIGDSPLERYWLAHLRREWGPFEKKVNLVYWNEVPFDEMVRRAAQLPSDSAIFFALLVQDAAGVPHEQEAAVEALRDAANAPLFGWSDNLLGHGIVGGPLLPLKEVGRATARAALRVLAGEPAGQVRSPVLAADRPSYDWRQLRRWGIDEASLPSRSTVLFHPTSLLRKYRWVILGTGLLIAAQAIAISGLLISRRRRLQAEEEAARLRHELAHAGRVSALGQLSSSLAHELNQPLGAILRNAEAAEIFLDATPPNLQEVRAILADIREDDQRAGGVIDGIRGLLRRHPVEFSSIELAGMAERMMILIRPDAQSRRIEVSAEVAPGLPDIHGNSVQLQQVLLNLLINGMEAMERNGSEGRRLRLKIGANGGNRVQMSVSDSGPGIPSEDLPRVFENFYTTKPGGMGMGLAICRQIVEAHGGEIEAANDPGGGTTFRVTLPMARVSA